MDVQTEASKDEEGTYKAWSIVLTNSRVLVLIAVAELILEAGPIVYFTMLLPK